MRLVDPAYEIITPIDGDKVLRGIERAGRVCYKSEDKITQHSHLRFVQNLVARGHESVLEHESITVKFMVDRGISHEIVRHRIASYSQSSTRYCNYSDEKFGGEISFVDIYGGMMLDSSMKHLKAETVCEIMDEWEDACKDAERHYMNMLELGASPQIARSVLNHSVMTELYVTMNLREWRHFFKLRTSTAAHPQMRQIAYQLLDELRKLIPCVFDDIEYVCEKTDWRCPSD